MDVSEGLTEAEAVSRVRNDRVVDSMIAGGITGGGLSGVFRKFTSRHISPFHNVTARLTNDLGCG